jgi:hypothetical protein
MITTSEFRSNSQSIAKKQEFLSERGRAGAYKKVVELVRKYSKRKRLSEQI